MSVCACCRDEDRQTAQVRGVELCDDCGIFTRERADRPMTEDQIAELTDAIAAHVFTWFLAGGGTQDGLEVIVEHAIRRVETRDEQPRSTFTSTSVVRWPCSCALKLLPGGVVDQVWCPEHSRELYSKVRNGL